MRVIHPGEVFKLLRSLKLNMYFSVKEVKRLIKELSLENKKFGIISSLTFIGFK